jgi:hypothetical protein
MTHRHITLSIRAETQTVGKTAKVTDRSLHQHLQNGKGCQTNPFPVKPLQVKGRLVPDLEARAESGQVVPIGIHVSVTRRGKLLIAPFPVV